MHAPAHTCYAVVGIHAQEQACTVYWIPNLVPASRLFLSAPCSKPRGLM
jgi:hypothetical protein